MSDYQFYSLLATTIVMLSGMFGWMIAWLSRLDKRVSEQEIKNAVIEAILNERGK